MRLILFIAVVTFLIFSSCSSTRQWTELSQQAGQAFEQNEYENALDLYEQYIMHFGHDATVIPDSIYRGAGLAAFELGMTAKALDYLNIIRHSDLADAPVQYALALSNREIDNLSREITALEIYVEKYPEAKKIEPMRQRYFETLVESRNYEQALELWPAIKSHAQKEEWLLERYFEANKGLENDDKLYDIASSLYSLNPQNTKALSHLAIHYFWKAENRYQDEVEAYENNRTHKQYAQLLRAFKILNADFRKSLDYFLTLYQLEPKPEYATYIGNIYLRFNDKGKAGYYHGKI